MPWMSSGTVSLRTSSTFLPCRAHSTAWSAVKTTWPEAAPGDAGRPLVATGSFFHSFGSKIGASSCDSAAGSTSSTASLGESSFSSTKSVAITTAAYPVRLPFRVCSMYSLLVLDRELEVLDVAGSAVSSRVVILRSCL